MEETFIIESLDRFARQHRRQRLVLALGHGALYGAALSLVLVLAGKVFNVPQMALGLLPLILVPGGAAAIAWLRGVPRRSLARAIDREAGLDLRVTTALEWIEQHRRPSLMARAQLHDAVEKLTPIVPRAVFPARWPRRRAWLAPVLLAAAVTLLLIPPWHLFPEDLSTLERESLKRQAAQLEQRAEELTKQAAANPKLAPRLDRVARSLQSLSKDLQSPGVTRREALAKVAAQREEIRQIQQDLQNALGTAGRPGSTGKPGDGGRLNPGQAEASRLQSAAEKLKKPGKLSQAERQSLQKSIQKALADPNLSRAARDALQKAARALENGGQKEAAKALEQAAQQMAGGVPSDTAQSLEQALSDLASAQEGLTGKPGPQDGPPGGAGKEVELAQGEPMGQGKPAPYSQGKGDRPGDFGKGSTNQERKSESKEALDYVLDRQKSNRSSTMTRAWERLHVPERNRVKVGNARIPGGKKQPGAVLATGEEARGAPTVGDGPTLAESDTYTQYRREAEEAMLRERIPAEHRDLIRGYFEEIDPSR